MTVTLQLITRENFDAVACLSVFEHQLDFLASNSYSIAEASFNPFLRTRAIYLGEEPVGFLMYLAPEAHEEPAGEYGIWRFMIDAKHQGKGLGRLALQLLLDEIRACGDATRIFISYMPDNADAQRFYASFGFRETEIDESGEMVAVLAADARELVSACAQAQAFILDLDGTMVDTLGDFVAVLERVLTELGLPVVDRAFVEKTVGRGSEHLIRSCLAQVGGAPELYEQAWALYQAQYRALNGQFAEVYPGVREGLQRLRALGLPMACLTNKPAAFARELLRVKGLDGFFDKVFGGDDFERKKPDPLPLLKTCEALGSEPAKTWMIGDSSNDAQAAHAAGCSVVLVSYGYNHGEPIRQVPAQQYVDRLDQIVLS